jgi:hypothetical protein
MEFNNQPQFAVLLFRRYVDEKQIFAALIVRIGYMVREDGTCESVTPPEVVRRQDEEKDRGIREHVFSPLSAWHTSCLIGGHARSQPSIFLCAKASSTFASHDIDGNPWLKGTINDCDADEYVR